MIVLFDCYTLALNFALYILRYFPYQHPNNQFVSELIRSLNVGLIIGVHYSRQGLALGTIPNSFLNYVGDQQ